MNKLVKLLAVALVALPLAASAASIQLGGPDRWATLGDATEGHIGSGNPLVGDINSLFGGSWTLVGDTHNGVLSNGGLTITLDQGAWGGQPVISGTWSIDSSFFDVYGSAVIAMHVGNGNGEPDFFAWLVSGTSGTWSYDVNNGGGGGLSNLHLWGSGEPTHRVPDNGMTAVLLGLGLVAVSFFARRRA